jgi:Ca-activated chloride channel homolog
MSNSLKVSTRLEYDKVALGKKNIVHLLVTLEGQKSDASQRKPLSIMGTIDVSGSMGEQGGKKIDYAKKSAMKLVDHLSENDTFGLVAFSGSVWTVVPTQKMTSEAKERAIREIEKLTPHSSTNLSGATIEAYKQLGASRAQADKDALFRAFLFTDGQPTDGEQNKDRLIEIAGQKPEGGSLTCFGYGEGCDGDLLSSMARKGSGNYYFVDSPDKCPQFFGAELGGLLSCVAQAIKVKVTANKGVKLLEVLNDLDVEASPDQTEATVTVDDAYSSEKRRVVIKLELPETDKALAARPIKIADVRVDFHDLLANEPRSEEAVVKIEYVKDDEVQKDADKEVAEQMLLAEAAKAQEEAIKMADLGNFAGAQALVSGMAARCADFGTAFSCSLSADLENNVKPMLEAQEYHRGGRHYTEANSKGYGAVRGMSLGSAKLFNTEEQNVMSAAFSDDHGVGVADPDVVVHNGPIPPQSAGTLQPMKTKVSVNVNVNKIPAKKPLSKQRTRRK